MTRVIRAWARVVDHWLRFARARRRSLAAMQATRRSPRTARRHGRAMRYMSADESVQPVARVATD